MSKKIFKRRGADAGAPGPGKEEKMREHKASAWLNANRRIASLVGGLAAIAILFTVCFCGAVTSQASSTTDTNDPSLLDFCG